VRRCQRRSVGGRVKKLHTLPGYAELEPHADKKKDGVKEHGTYEAPTRTLHTLYGPWYTHSTRTLRSTYG